MDVNKLCFGCMKENENPGQRCSHCGFDIKEYLNTCSARVLRPGTILNGQYLVGKVLGEGGFRISYLAMDLNLNLPVTIKEYFPIGLVVRNASEQEMTGVAAITGEKASFFGQGMEYFIEEARNLIRFQRVNTFFMKMEQPTW